MSASQNNPDFDDAPSALLLRIQAAQTVDELLRLTLLELSEAFGAERAAIRLGQPDEPVSSEVRPIHD